MSSLISFITSGGNHVTAFTNILLLLFFTLFCVFNNKKTYSIFPLFLAIIGFIIMFIAPGTNIRMQSFNQPTICKTLLQSFFQTIIYFRLWITSVWIFFLLMTTPVAIRFAKNNPVKNNKFPLLPFILSIVTIYGMLCVPYYAMSYFGEGRLTNVVWVAFIFLSLFNYFLFIRWLYYLHNENIKLVNVESYHKGKPIIIFISLILILCLNQNNESSSVIKALKELSNGTAQQYSCEVDKRYEKIKNSYTPIVKIDPIKTKSELLFFDDITNDITNWKNVDMSNYYGKQIVLK